VNVCSLECHFLSRLLPVSNKNISVLQTIKIVVKIFIETSTSVNIKLSNRAINFVTVTVH